MEAQYWALAQVGAGGLVQGSTYILIASGFALSMGVLKILNLAHGHFLMLGSFFAFFLAQLLGFNAGYLVAIPLTMVAVASVGAGTYVIGIRPLQKRGYLAAVLSTLALAYLMESLGLIFWRGGSYNFVTPYTEAIVDFGEVHLTQQKLLSLLIGLALVVVLWAFLNRTTLGRAIRATSQDEEATKLMGISPQRMFIVALAISAALAGAAGALVGPFFSIMVSGTGLAWLFKAFVVVVLAGLGSMRGTVIAGLGLGLMEAYVGYILGANWITTAEFGLIAIVLIVRPRGIFG